MNPRARSGRMIQLIPAGATPAEPEPASSVPEAAEPKPGIVLERETGLEPATLSLEG